MLKGHTRIELRNVETGEVEVHEDDNLVTKAIDYIINMEVARNAYLNDYCMPVATQLLGGIMLFDEVLEESVDNVHFPTNVHLVGYAGQTANTEDAYCGVYNTAESGKTDSGFVSVWDFGTSQANGTIKSVARTHRYGGQNPIRYFKSPIYSQRRAGIPDNDTGWSPIRYDGEYLYMIKGNSNTHLMRLARVKFPMLKFGVGEYSADKLSYEVIASWDTEIHSWHYVQDQYYEYDYTVYVDDPIHYEDGRDGYIYAFIGDGNGESGETLNYFRIKYSDESYEKSEPATINIGLTYYYYSTTTGGCKYFQKNLWHINSRTLYLMSRDRKSVYMIPLDNIPSKRSIRFVAADNDDYMLNIHNVTPHNGGIWVIKYHYTTSGYQYQNGILYPDGTYIVLNIAGTSDENYWGYPRCCCDELEILSRYYGDGVSVGRDWAANYLGTINNLTSAITKTSAQTMKIVYTLTDVDE